MEGCTLNNFYHVGGGLWGPAGLLLERHNQAKIKKTRILFWLLNMAIRCEHNDHRLELWKSFEFWFAVAT